MARFEMIRKVARFDSHPMLDYLKHKPGEAPALGQRETAILEAMNSLPLRQRLVNMVVHDGPNGRGVVVDLYVENTA